MSARNHAGIRTAGLWLLVGMLPAAAAAQSLQQAATYSSALYLGIRYRDTTLISDQYVRHGHAHTARLQLGYLWAFDPHWAAYVEGTGVWSLFGREYNDTSGRVTGYPSEADPPGKEISSAWLGYRNQRVELRLGRQYIRLDNERFFARNGWRQHPQSFDGLSSRWQLASQTVLRYDWLGSVHRTVGGDFDDVTQRRWHLQAHVLHAQQGLPLGVLAAYVYLIRNDTNASNSVRTRGLSWSGQASPDQGLTQFVWTAVVARQDSYANNPRRFDLGYHQFELNYGLSWISARAGEEWLGGNGRTGFNIAYGSGHPFDGWVGVFSIPVTGLRDRYAGLHGSFGAERYSWQLVYHHFDATLGHLAYGHELDAGLLAQWSSRFSTELQYGHYQGRNYSFDQHKLWLILEYRYGTQTL
ncbi:alginate export family protein [Frateuria aurantia]